MKMKFNSLRTKTALALAICAFAALAFAACSPAKTAKSLNLDKARADIEALETFPSLMEPDDAQLKTVYGLDASLMQKRAAGVPLINVHASMYWLALAKDEADADALRAQFKTYFDGYQRLWDNYLPAQADLVKNRLETSYNTDEGIWLLYAVAEDTAAVRAAVENALVF